MTRATGPRSITPRPPGLRLDTNGTSPPVDAAEPALVVLRGAWMIGMSQSGVESAGSRSGVSGFWSE